MTSTLALTPGEPAGIGPDLCVQLAQHSIPGCRLVAIADPVLLQQRAQLLKLPLKLQEFNADSPPAADSAVLEYLACSLATSCSPGQPDKANAPYVLNTLREAVRGCQDGRFAAMVTGPVQKSVINDAGIVFSGHTEFLAELCGVPRVVMMLATTQLKVALATTHLPLSAVAASITPALLEEVLQILHDDLRSKFGHDRPRIVIAGLNPHAGENGHLGREEIDIMIPVINKMRKTGMKLLGPLPADTLFTPRYLQDADAVLAMYHDQGLPVLKYQGFGEAVNITLGLPIIRTSVDHGTALDLAGTGKADTGSLQAAIAMAVDMAEKAAQQNGTTEQAL